MNAGSEFSTKPQVGQELARIDLSSHHPATSSFTTIVNAFSDWECRSIVNKCFYTPRHSNNKRHRRNHICFNNHKIPQVDGADDELHTTSAAHCTLANSKVNTCSFITNPVAIDKPTSVVTQHLLSGDPPNKILPKTFVLKIHSQM